MLVFPLEYIIISSPRNDKKNDNYCCKETRINKKLYFPPAMESYYI